MIECGANQTVQKGVIVIAILANLSACSTPRTLPLGGTVAQAGITASDNALAAYDTLGSLSEVERDRAQLGNILTFPDGVDPWAAGLKPTDRTLQSALVAREQAFRDMRGTFKEFNLLSDSALGTNSEAAGQKLSSALTAFSAAAGTPLPDQVVTPLPGVAKAVTEQLQAGAIKQHNRYLRDLASNANTLWMEDLPYWKLYIDSVYDSLVNQVRSLPAEKFDAVQLAKILPEPYTNYIRVRLFKEKFQKEADVDKLRLQAQLDGVTTSLNALELATTELAKDEPSVNDIGYWVSSIRTISGN